MSQRNKLESHEIERRLPTLSGWELRDDKLRRTYEFPDFVEAFGFMTRVALAAEKADHHPDWRNVYGRVEIELTTHDAGGLTEADFTLASTVDRLAGSRQARE